MNDTTGTGTETESRGQGRVSTGVPGADDVLDGGLIDQSATLLRGEPGAGKTIFALHFLTDTDAEDTGLFINLGEPTAYLRSTAEAFGRSLAEVSFLSLSPTSEQFHDDETYTLFESAEVERPSLVDEIRDEVAEIDPDRVVVDPVTEFRYLTTDTHQFRTQVLSLLDFLKSTGATTMLTSQAASSMPDDDLQFLVDTVINLGDAADRKTMRVTKSRGSGSRRGSHTLVVDEDGMVVWPRLVPERHEVAFTPRKLSSGVEPLDALLHGGLTTGTVTFLSGPTGVGKTTTGLQFLHEAASRGQQAVLYSFEENTGTLRDRAEAIGTPIDGLIESGQLEIAAVEPEQWTVGEFTGQLRGAVADGAEVVMIDGVSGFTHSLRGLAADPADHLVKIGRYLRNTGVTGLVTNEVHAITGEVRATEQNVSHLADNILVLRHIEYNGQLRKVIGVLKMRASDFETRLRELAITDEGLVIGEPLTGLRGILTGTPEWVDGASPATDE